MNILRFILRVGLNYSITGKIEMVKNYILSKLRFFTRSRNRFLMDAESVQVRIGER